MVGQLALVGVLVLAAYAVGYWVGRSDGRSDGRAEAMRRWRRVSRMSELFQAARFDEPGSPRLA